MSFCELCWLLRCFCNFHLPHSDDTYCATLLCVCLFHTSVCVFLYIANFLCIGHVLPICVYLSVLWQIGMCRSCFIRLCVSLCTLTNCCVAVLLYNSACPSAFLPPTFAICRSCSTPLCVFFCTSRQRFGYSRKHTKGRRNEECVREPVDVVQRHSNNSNDAFTHTYTHI